MTQSVATADRKGNEPTGQEPGQRLPAASARADEAAGPERRPSGPPRQPRQRCHRKRYAKPRLPAKTPPTAAITRSTHALSPPSAQRKVEGSAAFGASLSNAMLERSWELLCACNCEVQRRLRFISSLSIFLRRRELPCPFFYQTWRMFHGSNRLNSHCRKACQ